ncbi:MAG TPA: hypothetical protein VK524_16330 [Polyangiaceae bacterium]|nr:hypothetical protein [Polyangiaceae bacterium]
MLAKEQAPSARRQTSWVKRELFMVAASLTLFNACEPPKGCPTSTGYVGDELCIAAPEAGQGIQLHVGPSVYDAAHIAPFLQPAQTENVQCYFGKSPNTEPMYYFEQEIRMRPGTHHLIMTILNEDVPDGWGACKDPFGFGSGQGGIPGSQTTVRSIPGTEQVAPENRNLARLLPARAQIQYQLHYYNFSDKPIMREVWVNLHEKDPSQATQPLKGIGLIGGLDLAVPAQSRGVYRYGCTVNGTGRVYDLFGHYHAHTERFSIWRIRNGQSLHLYDSFDWVHPANLTYDSVNTNWTADRVNRVPGGYSGIVDVFPGDRFEWECEINNVTSGILRFANEVYTAEMCITFGSFVPSTPTGSGLSCIGGRIR